MTISDDILSAYLDGELAPDEAERVRALAARDERLARRLERMRLAGQLAREAFAPLAETTPALRIAAGQERFAQLARPAVAALAACAAGIVLGVSIRGEGAERLVAFENGMIAAPAAARLLETTASGASGVRGGVAITPIYSFRDEDGRACRVFRAAASGATMEAAACRDGGDWRILALAPVSRGGDGFVQAGSDEHAAISAAVDRAWAGEIDAEEEARLIARGWR